MRTVAENSPPNAIGVAVLIPSLLVAIFLVTIPLVAQQAIGVSYQFAIEGRPGPVASGTVWLYHYLWYGLHRYELATIENGVARIRLT